MQMFRDVVILLVEDDLGDQRLIEKSLCNEKILNELVTVNNAENALQYLQRCQDSDKESPRPDLILLDLNMPGMGGKEFLKHIKNNPELNDIPVVVLTTSDSEQDVLESYKLQAAGYIKKPVTLQGFQQMMSDMEEYWFVVCKRVVQRQPS
jgi:CheY-like chemotaxis protein